MLRQHLRDSDLEFLHGIADFAALLLASDFFSDPRWSMAAAAITPRSFETFLSPATFPE